MPFEFSLLDFKLSNCKCNNEKYKPKNQQEKFAKFSKICHKTSSQKRYYKCMSKNLKK